MVSYWMPEAIKKPISHNYTRASRATTDSIIMHVADSEATTLFTWFNNPKALASSHFYVRYDGTIEQYVDIRYIAWASGAANSRGIHIETQGKGNGTWTDAQLASIQKIITWCRAIYPSIPNRLMASSKKTEKGIGYHRLGVPANSTQKAQGISQTGGELWSSAVGKTCPGPERIKQMPLLIVSLATGGVNLGKTVTPAPAPAAPAPAKPAPKPAPVPNASKYLTAKISVKTLQTQLSYSGAYTGQIHGIMDAQTVAAIKRYQDNQRYFPNLLRDNIWGPYMQAHYNWVRTLQTALNKWAATKRLGSLKIDGDYGTATQHAVKETMSANLAGAYAQAVHATYGTNTTPAADGIPGIAFCRMVGVKTHPTATK